MKALITAQFHESGMQILAPLMEVQYENFRETGKIYFDGEEFAKRILDAGADVVIVEADLIHEEVFSACDLKIIGCCRGDPLNVSAEDATQRGIPILYTPARNADAVADLAVGFMIGLARNIVWVNHLLRSGKMHFESEKDIVSVFNRFGGFELGGSTIGIVGFGAIGQKVAERLKPFGAKLLVYDPYAVPATAAARGVELVGLNELLERSDIVSLHCAMTDETQGMIGKAELSRMKPTAYFINTAKSFLADEGALLEALREGRLAGAALDVFDHEPIEDDNPFLALENVIVAPHLGGATRDVVRHQSEMIASDIARYLSGERPLHIWNPEILKEGALQ